MATIESLADEVARLKLKSQKRRTTMLMKVSTQFCNMLVAPLRVIARCSIIYRT